MVSNMLLVLENDSRVKLPVAASLVIKTQTTYILLLRPNWKERKKRFIRPRDFTVKIYAQVKDPPSMYIYG